MTRKTISELLEQVDKDTQEDDLALWGGTISGQVGVFHSPKLQTIVTILQENPILIQPALNWLLEKRAHMARAQLETLYTAEQLEQMYDEARKKEK